MAEPLVIDDRITLPAAELAWTAVRASGAGGQNVNKVASKVELVFDLAATRVLSEAVRARLVALAGRRLDGEGRLHVQSQRYRDQPRNLEDAREKLRELVLAALAPPPPPRRPTRPSRAAKRRRVEDKRRMSDKKRERSRTGD